MKKKIIKRDSYKKYIEMVKFGDDRFKDGYNKAIKKAEKMIEEIYDISNFTCGTCSSDYIIGLDSFKISIKQQLQKLKEKKW